MSAAYTQMVHNQDKKNADKNEYTARNSKYVIVKIYPSIHDVDAFKIQTVQIKGRHKCGTYACLSCLLQCEFTVNIVRYILANK